MSCLIKPFHCIHCSCILNYHPLSGQKYYLYWKFAHYFVSCFKCFLTLWLSLYQCHLVSVSWLTGCTVKNHFSILAYDTVWSSTALVSIVHDDTHTDSQTQNSNTWGCVFVTFILYVHVCVYGPTYYLTTLKTCCIHTSLFLIPFLLTGPIMPRHFGSPTRS